MMLPDPRDYQLPHDTFRENQFNSLEWCINLKGVGIISSPVGSGKTAFARGVASRKRVIALSRTKVLQQENYGKMYGFDVLYGRGNYPCVHRDAAPWATAAECLFEEEMHKCPVALECPYLIQKDKAQGSMHAALNYAYWQTSWWPRKNPSKALFLDEAHLLSGIVRGWAGCTIREEQRREWGLPTFLEFGTSDMSPRDIYNWLNKCILILRNTYDDLIRWKQPEKARKCQSLLLKLEHTKSALAISMDDWFVRSGRKARKNRRKEKVPGLVCKPLTARYHFPKQFIVSDSTVLMSATIGEPNQFAAELGIQNYYYHAVPSRFSPEARPVRVLDIPGLGYKNTKRNPGLWKYQADKITALIKSYPEGWIWLIHLQAKYKIFNLAKMLRTDDDLWDRVWVTPRGGTNTQMEAWSKRRITHSGTIILAWSWDEGVDLGEVHGNISADTPFPYLGDEYNKARMNYDKEEYKAETARRIEQRLGRNRRGYKEHYNLNGREPKVCAIACGNWRMIEEYFSNDFRASLVME
jgi:Rad3-related DNA helicase